MQDSYLYEYAVIRIVPRLEREEFINVGLLLFCKQSCYIRIAIALNEEKLKFYPTECDVRDIKANLLAWEKIAMGSEAGGAIAALDVAERFRWLTAVRSTVLQTSRPHSGLTACPDRTFEKLFAELVL